MLLRTALVCLLLPQQALAQLPSKKAALNQAPSTLRRSYKLCPTAGQKLASLKLSDFTGQKALLVATFYTGCSPGRFIAPGYAAFCASMKKKHPNKFDCVVSLKGSADCKTWAAQYFKPFAKDGPHTVQDRDASLHYSLFDGNPQFALLDLSSRVRIRFKGGDKLYSPALKNPVPAASKLEKLVAQVMATPAPVTPPPLPPPPQTKNNYTTSAPPSGRQININWVVKGYPPRTATVGDIVRFTWVGQHNVYLHPSGSCDPAHSIMVGSSRARKGVFKFTNPGKYIFACQIGSHCQVGQILTINVKARSSAASTVAPTPAPACAPAFGLKRAVQVVFNSVHGLTNPRDMAFHPIHRNQLWVANHDSDDIAILDTQKYTSTVRADRAAYHYMEKISALAFDQKGQFATCQDSLNAYNGMQKPNHFMGPTLFDSSPSALVDQLGNDKCDTSKPDSKACYFTHIDMLHESPQCVGIAHDPETVTPFRNVYWLFDGKDGMLMRYDFQAPHGPGSLDHSQAAVRRYHDIKLSRVEGVPGHVVMDPDPKQRVLYVADTGRGRILRINPDSGKFLRNAKAEYPIYSSLAASFTYEVWGCTEWEVFADGLAVPAGLHIDGDIVYVGERNTSRIIAFHKHTKKRLSHVNTGALGLNGFDTDAQGQLWYSDGASNTVSRVLVEQACPAATSSGSGNGKGQPQVKYPTRQCTDVVNRTVKVPHSAHAAGYMNLSAFIGISDYANAKKHHCGGNSITLGAHTAGMPTADANGTYRINNDALLMSGYMCHICLPQPCQHGGVCTHVPASRGGVASYGTQKRRMSGFTCKCQPGYSGDICQRASGGGRVALKPTGGGGGGGVCKKTGLPLTGDIDGDAKVNVEDLLKVLANFGSSC